MYNMVVMFEALKGNQCVQYNVRVRGNAMDWICRWGFTGHGEE